MHSLQQSLQEKSWETEKHTMRLRAIVTRLAKALDLSRAVIDDLALLAALHDIGKIAIPDDILNKPGPLTEEEWTIMKRHPEIGYRIARTSPELVSIAEYILSHHERWDGKGYPRGLVGENIPLPARLLSVADAFDAMTSDRPYRKAMSAQQALAELERNAGTQFDPDVVAAFVEMFHSGLEQELKGDAIAASP
jgi:HD-GYP domain-containing protein (c-di-GMP phosphodiesterase class II)